MFETMSFIFLFIGITILAGFICMFLGNKANKNIQGIGGWNLYCLFGMIGVPVHELSHLIMCLIFLHKPTKVELFRPIKGKKDGFLGFVQHSYQLTRYRKAGNFLIGAAPMVFGSIIIGLILLIFVPNFYSELYNISNIKELFLFLGNGFSMFFTFENLKTWQFWLALYFIISISINMNMSKPDVKNSLSGIVSSIIFYIIMVFNIYAIPGLSFLGYYIKKFMFMYVCILFFGCIISLCSMLLTYIILKLKKLITGRKSYARN